jgi:hypothetical protein
MICDNGTAAGANLTRRWLRMGADSLIVMTCSVLSHRAEPSASDPNEGEVTPVPSSGSMLILAAGRSNMGSLSGKGAAAAMDSGVPVIADRGHRGAALRSFHCPRPTKASHLPIAVGMAINRGIGSRMAAVSRRVTSRIC